MKLLNTSDYLIKPGSRADVRKMATRYDGPLDKDQGQAATLALGRRMSELQDRLYAEGKRSLLVVFQAMDAAGKDSAIRQVFNPLDPAGCHVTSFKAPSKEELAHDYLWRIHQHAPAHGEVAVFNRSHYEDVLIVKVKRWAPPEVVSRRYDHINNFEKMLVDEGTTVLKFKLHVSKEYQRQRLQRRLSLPEKHWKFNPEDLTEREHWDDYMLAFNQMLSRCSTPHAPWHVVPAERRWFRNLLITQVVVEALERIDPQVPRPAFDPAAVVIP